MTGLATKTPETLVTTLLDAVPDHRLAFPTATLWPLITAMAVILLFIGSIFTPWAVVWGAIPVAIAVTAWFCPTRKDTEEHLALETKP